VRVQQEVERRVRKQSGLKILDVGAVGPRPFDLWEPLFEAGDFHLTAVDVEGVERASSTAAMRGWKVDVRRGSGYTLDELFEPARFDLVIATQVLEHVARIDRFMGQVARVLVPGGEAFFTFDSAHWRPRWSPRWPRRLAKNMMKKLLAGLGSERHYDLPWRAEEIIEACRAHRLDVVEVAYHNLPDVKRIHNHFTPDARKDALMSRWYELEWEVNLDPRVALATRDLFAGVYIHGRRG
jgi:2-polyprenyl-3-methyl-5-hydroxy-6-metoxy-1,4-benzoquinol methylase